MEITKSASGRRWLERWLKADVEGHEEAKKVAKTWPRLEVTSAEFKVIDEKVVTPLSIVSLTVKCRYVYPGSNPANGTAAAAKEEKVSEKVSKSAPAKGEADKEKPAKPVGYVHAPMWPANRSPGFSLLLGDSKLDKVIVQPTRLADIPMPNADGTPAEPREYRLQFQAPPQPNLYSFVAFFQSDSLVAGDVAKPIMLKVDAAASEDDSDDDISEPEEDSLAGQMAIMRGEKVKPSPVHGEDDESEYETDTDSDEDDKPAAASKARKGRAINEDTESDSD
jgi:translocation protein SEC63